MMVSKKDCISGWAEFHSTAVGCALKSYGQALFKKFEEMQKSVGRAPHEIETYLPRFFNRTICTRVIYGSIIVSLLLGIGTAIIVKRAILHQGYFHCEGAAIHRKLLRIETYVLDEDTCRQLTLERKKRKFLGMR